jgi:hypothetical protein
MMALIFVVMLPGRKFVGGCVAIAAAVFLLSLSRPLPVGLLAGEVFLTILGLFLFGSFKHQIHKNALTYGMLLIVAATFCGLSGSEWHREVAEQGWGTWIRQHLLSFRGLDELVHADTMLFILGLTFFVAVIAQTRVLEGITFALLRRNRGVILPTVISVTAVVAFASGVLDGVSMIGLTIRTLVIVLMLAAAPREAILHAIMICTAVTTVCGVWLAYGEPPNLIMKANLHPWLGSTFFLGYCGPIAVGAYLVVARHLSKTLAGWRLDLDALDVIDANAEDVRFLQATRHGEVLTPMELIEEHAGQLDGKAEQLLRRLSEGKALGIALVEEGVPAPTRRKLLGHFVSEDLAEPLDRHYVLDVAGDHQGARQAERAVDEALAASAHRRKRAQLIGAAGLVPFVALLFVHGVFQDVPLFLASFAGFAVAIWGIAGVEKMRALAFREACHEYAEYLFLFPLFLSITLLSKAGFFAQIEALIRYGVVTVGIAHIAWGQFLGATFLSAILDNNAVADFGSRALLHMEAPSLHLFAMAQIAGYALGGCWTHIGCAQSVVAYSFIQRDLEPTFTPTQWIRTMTPVILEMMAVVSAIIYAERAILRLV